MHNSGVFVTRSSRSRGREYIKDGHALRENVGKAEEQSRESELRTHKKCTRSECKEARVSSPGRVARRKILKSEWGEHVVLRTRQEDSGVRRRRGAARVGAEGLVEISREKRGKSINI